MYSNILEYLTCPECKKSLDLNTKKQVNGEVIEGILRCSNNHEWKVEDGVINFESEEQKSVNNWSESYKQVDYEELENQIKERTPQIQLDAQERAKEEIIKLIDKHNAKNILDIATGRGMLLKRIVKNFGDEIDLVCIDLSFEVLKYDRMKANKINSNAKINYIACDATNLPFTNDAFDLSVSFAGIQNMLDKASKGIKEGVRVSKDKLINVGVVIKDDNPKIDLINKLLAENNIDYDVKTATESSFYQLHKINDNFKVEVDNIFEGIAEKNDNDLIPIEDEWFAIAIIKTKKIETSVT